MKKSAIYLIFIFVVLFLLFSLKTNFDKSKILTECATIHLKNNIHYHAQLDIVQNGNKIIVPANIGIIGDNCIHPIHTHDTTGFLHFDYVRAIPFTLGDFFDMQGLIFTNNQIGSIKTTDGYKIKLSINGKVINANYRNVVIKDKDKILISITFARVLDKAE